MMSATTFGGGSDRDLPPTVGEPSNASETSQDFQNSQKSFESSSKNVLYAISPSTVLASQAATFIQ